MKKLTSFKKTLLATSTTALTAGTIFSTVIGITSANNRTDEVSEHSSVFFDFPDGDSIEYHNGLQRKKIILTVSRNSGILPSSLQIVPISRNISHILFINDEQNFDNLYKKEFYINIYDNLEQDFWLEDVFAFQAINKNGNVFSSHQTFVLKSKEEQINGNNIILTDNNAKIKIPYYSFVEQNIKFFSIETGEQISKDFIINCGLQFVEYDTSVVISRNPSAETYSSIRFTILNSINETTISTDVSFYNSVPQSALVQTYRPETNDWRVTDVLPGSYSKYDTLLLGIENDGGNQINYSVGNGCFKGDKMPSSVKTIVFANADEKRLWIEDEGFSAEGKTTPSVLEKIIFLETPKVRLGAKCFSNSVSLPQVKIPLIDTDVSLPNGAFKGCSSLQRFEISSSTSEFTSIPDGFFSNDSLLTSVIFPQSSTILSVGASAFENCEILYDITFLNNLTYIGDYAFRNCVSLSEIKFDKVKTIGIGSFAQCHSIRSVIVPDIVTISDNAFENCSLLSKIKLSTEAASTLNSIGAQAFKDCNLLGMSINDDEQNGVKIVETVEIYGDNLFCSIGAEAFYNCVSITKIIMNGVYSIGARAFSSIKGFSSFTDEYGFYDDFIDIGFFGQSSGLKSVHMIQMPSIIEVGQVIQPLFGISPTTVIGGLACGTVYISQLTITGGVLGPKAFEECLSLNEVIFNSPDFTATIGEETFLNCTSLKRVDLTYVSTATPIGNRAFYECSQLSSINFSETLENGKKVFGSNGFAASRIFGNNLFPYTVHLRASEQENSDEWIRILGLSSARIYFDL